MYKIQTEGRNIKEVVKVGRTFRMDVQGSLKGLKIKELKKFVYRTKLGNTLSDGTKVYYVEVIREAENKKENRSTIPANKKHFVIKNAFDLGIESGYVDDRTGKFIPTWYIWDKNINDIVQGEMYEGEGARASAKRTADKLNMNGL